MKNRVLSMCVAAAMLLTVLIAAGPAQASIKTQLHFEINVPYRIRMGNYVLPPDKYYLYQVDKNDLNLFFLFRGDMRHTPIAAVRTVRVDHSIDGYPQKTEIDWVMDEHGSYPLPVVTGWDLPGHDGWQIIGVVPRGHGHEVMAKVHS
jgi:hypothetical protein